MSAPAPRSFFVYHGWWAAWPLAAACAYALAVYSTTEPLAHTRFDVPAAPALEYVANERSYVAEREASRNRTAALDGAILRGSAMRAHPLLREPFSIASNLAYLSAALGVATLPRVGGAPTPMPALGFASTAAMMGGGSLVFHAAGSLTHTWQHHADRLGMLALLVATCVLGAHGSWHAVRGTSWDGASAADVGFAGAQLVGIFGVFPLNWALDPTPAPDAAEPSDAAADGAATGAHARGGAAGVDASRFFTAIGALGAVICALTVASACLTIRDARHVGILTVAVIVLFAAAFALNLGLGAPAKRRAQFDAALSAAARVEAQQLYDICHGLWHHLTALGLVIPARVALEARRRPPLTGVAPAGAADGVGRGWRVHFARDRAAGALHAAGAVALCAALATWPAHALGALGAYTLSLLAHTAAEMRRDIRRDRLAAAMAEPTPPGTPDVAAEKHWLESDSMLRSDARDAC